MLLGIIIGVYFTFNLFMTLLLRADVFENSEGGVNWYWWPLLALFGLPVGIWFVTQDYLKTLNRYLIRNSWYYTWLADTLSYEKHLGVVNRMNKRQLQRLAITQLRPINWPRRKLIERINERLKETEPWFTTYMTMSLSAKWNND